MVFNYPELGAPMSITNLELDRVTHGKVHLEWSRHDTVIQDCLVPYNPDVLYTSGDDDAFPEL
jgi:hypothetical protein